MIGEIIGAGASLIGGMLNRDASEKNAAANIAWQREQQDKNIAMQREFAQQGVRWKVDDARSAGVHPLFALGASTHSFAPQSVGSYPEANHSMGDALASAGQNVGRAVQAGMTKEERDTSKVADALQLERAGLQNELLRTQILSLKGGSQIGPAMPSIAKKSGSKAVVDTSGSLTLIGQGDADRSIAMPHGAVVVPRKNETPAQDVEDEYGDGVSDIQGAYRYLKDSGISLGGYLGGLVSRPQPAHVPLKWDAGRHNLGWRRSPYRSERRWY